MGDTMVYPAATAVQSEAFQSRGFIVVRDAIPQPELDALEHRLDRIIDEKETLAGDWAWDASETREQRSFRIVQAFPHKIWTDLADAPFRRWARDFGSALLGRPVSFRYDQFLGKPPGKSAPTYWHQDEAYWGRSLSDRGITCWMPMQNVDEVNGCMHFIEGGHMEGVYEHHRVAGVQSDLLTCAVDESRMVACPITRGDVTFHHSKMPHMTPANRSQTWRKALTQHLWEVGSETGDHYPWRVEVSQTS
jgi:ectoine hydroxylase-related dioxygenase (phytanoyl-CoA dioxygenase family)